MRKPEVADHSSLGIVFLFLFIMILVRASAEEVLLTAQQPIVLGNNITLMIEDVNYPEGVIWLKLYNGNETIDSAVIRLGGHLRSAGKNITLHEIYSGGDEDLVALIIENEMVIFGNASQRSTAAPQESRLQRYPPFF